MEIVPLAAHFSATGLSQVSKNEFTRFATEAHCLPTFSLFQQVEISGDSTGIIGTFASPRLDFWSHVANALARLCWSLGFAVFDEVIRSASQIHISKSRASKKAPRGRREAAMDVVPVRTAYLYGSI